MGGAQLKNLVDVLKQKISDMENLQQEVEALQTALRLCAENDSEATLADTRPLKIAAGSEGSAPAPGLTPRSLR